MNTTLRLHRVAASVRAFRFAAGLDLYLAATKVARQAAYVERGYILQTLVHRVPGTVDSKALVRRCRVPLLLELGASAFVNRILSSGAVTEVLDLAEAALVVPFSAGEFVDFSHRAYQPIGVIVAVPGTVSGIIEGAIMPADVGLFFEEAKLTIVISFTVSLQAGNAGHLKLLRLRSAVPAQSSMRPALVILKLLDPELGAVLLLNRVTGEAHRRRLKCGGRGFVRVALGETVILATQARGVLALQERGRDSFVISNVPTLI